MEFYLLTQKDRGRALGTQSQDDHTTPPATFQNREFRAAWRAAHTFFRGMPADDRDGGVLPDWTLLLLLPDPCAPGLW